jgi:ATP-dependent RNA helicase DDX21
MFSELAKQIGAEIEDLSNLSVITLYGGTPTQPQGSMHSRFFLIIFLEQELRQGMDVVVGTPGRIQDLLERGSLSFEDIKVTPIHVTYNNLLVCHFGRSR